MSGPSQGHKGLFLTHHGTLIQAKDHFLIVSGQIRQGFQIHTVCIRITTWFNRLAPFRQVASALPEPIRSG